MNWKDHLRQLSTDDLQHELALRSGWARSTNLSTKERKEADKKLRDVEREIRERREAGKFPEKPAIRGTAECPLGHTGDDVKFIISHQGDDGEMFYVYRCACGKSFKSYAPPSPSALAQNSPKKDKK
ncbi:MAG: hypothetical protein K8R36_25165 [Planctomycetales bacterium]|nr:hypothetical protein [Planctomycetales bacterium]